MSGIQGLGQPAEPVNPVGGSPAAKRVQEEVELQAVGTFLATADPQMLKNSQFQHILKEYQEGKISPLQAIEIMAALLMMSENKTHPAAQKLKSLALDEPHSRLLINTGFYLQYMQGQNLKNPTPVELRPLEDLLDQVVLKKIPDGKAALELHSLMVAFNAQLGAPAQYPITNLPALFGLKR